VIAFGRGGSLETVVEGKSGVFFRQQTPESLAEAVDAFEAVRENMDPEWIRAHAERFRPERFRREIAELVDRLWNRFQRCHCAAYVPRSPFPLDARRSGSGTAVGRRAARRGPAADRRSPGPAGVPVDPPPEGTRAAVAARG
jgi:hypothetical protein